MATSPSPENKLRPRDFQFSIARILIATTLAACLLTVNMHWTLDLALWTLAAALLLSVVFGDWSVMQVHDANTAIAAGNYPRAVDAYSKAIAAKPRDAMRYYGRAVAYHHNADLAEAIADYGEAIRLDPKFVEAWIGRAGAAYAGELYQRVIDDSTVALCLVPGNLDLAILRAAATAMLGDTDTSLADITDIIWQHPECFAAYQTRGTVYLLTDQYRLALADFETASQPGTPTCDLDIGRSAAYFKLGDYAKALSVIQQCRAQYPESATATGMHARFLATCPDDRFRDGQQALSLASACHEMGERPWRSYGNLAAAYAEIGQFDKAVKYAHTALETVPPVRRDDFQAHLKCYVSRRPFRDTCRESADAERRLGRP